MVINSIDINKTKESLNRDGDQFHRYQQNEHSSFTIAELTEHNNKQTTTYHVILDGKYNNPSGMCCHDYSDWKLQTF
jgi:hypothetical protein